MRTAWQVDLIDYSKRNLTGDRYILTAVDVFSRKLAVEAIPNKQPSTVLEAFQKIVRRLGGGHYPEQVTTDNGQELGDLFTRHINSFGTVHATKDTMQVNTQAVVDRAIGKFQGILKNLVAKGGTWSANVPRAAANFNERPNTHLLGASPDEVDKNAVLDYQLEKEAGEDIKPKLAA